MGSPSVVELWLFGSVARDETREGEQGYRRPSDMDFLAVTNASDGSQLQVATDIYQRLDRSRILRPVDVIVWTKEQWAQAAEHALGRRVLKEGRRV